MLRIAIRRAPRTVCAVEAARSTMPDMAYRRIRVQLLPGYYPRASRGNSRCSCALPFQLQMPPRPDDERHLVTAIDLARRSREKGNHPFGSLLVDSEGEVVLEAENTAVAGGDLLGHAELNLARAACSQFGRDFLQGCTLYTSTEPCAMCAGAIYWSGIGRVVYALSSETLEAIVNDEEGESRLALRCRRVFASGGRSVQVEGPLLEDRAREVHQNFW
jgi:tRNA(Arg) A34 adenosine deaminase TadA